MATYSKYCLFMLFLAFCSDFNAQVQIDHQLKFTGTGDDARITGIDSVSAEKDAVNVKTLQSGRLIYSAATGSSNNFTVAISPPINSYTQGLMVNFMANHGINGPATLDVNGLGQVSITKNINSLLDECDIANGQMVSVIYDGTNFQMISPAFSTAVFQAADAGPDQSGISGISATLAAVLPPNSSGYWNIVSGDGGSLTDPSNPTTDFSGVGGNTYTLSWTVTYSCGSDVSTVDISFNAPYKRVFISSTSYNGNMGGLAGADNNCQTRANAAALGGTWKAFLSANSTANWVANRLSQSSGPYALLNGTQIAANWSALISGVLDAEPNINEFGNTVSSQQVWTDTYTPGGAAVNGNSGMYDCSGWSSSSSGGDNFSAVGKTAEYAISGQWTFASPSGCLGGYGRCYQYCNSSLALICIEQ